MSNKNHQNKKSILIVEDDVSIRKIISTKLQEEGYNVLCVSNGEEALEVMRINGHLPNLVWLDIYLPKMDGFQFLEHIRKDKKLRNLPVIVVSVSGSNAKIQQAKKLGALEYCVKSNFKIDELTEKVNLLLKKE